MTTEPTLTANPGGGNQPGSGAPVTPTTQTAPPSAQGNEPQTVSLTEAELNAKLAAAKKDGETRATTRLQKELDDLKAARMTEEEKRIAEAKKQGEQEANKTWAAKLLAAKLEARGYPPDWAGFVDCENAEDAAAIDAAIKAASEKHGWFKPLSAPHPGAIQGGGQTAGKPVPPEKWSRERLRNTPFNDQIGKYKQEIAEAYRKGEILPD